MKTDSNRPNGIDRNALEALIESVRQDPGNGQTRWGVTTRWQGGTVTETEVSGFEIGGQRVAKDFRIRIDEPVELGGSNTEPNPQEVLLAATNACMTVGYAAVATLMGIELESLEIETGGDIDLRGFLGLEAGVKPGYDALHYTVRIKSSASPEQLRELHETVARTSPNRFNIGNAIALTSDLVIEGAEVREVA
jgi:uncharacterized OsmC-like protein